MVAVLARLHGEDDEGMATVLAVHICIYVAHSRGEVSACVHGDGHVLTQVVASGDRAGQDRRGPGMWVSADGCACKAGGGQLASKGPRKVSPLHLWAGLMTFLYPCEVIGGQ